MSAEDFDLKRQLTKSCCLPAQTGGSRNGALQLNTPRVSKHDIAQAHDITDDGPVVVRFLDIQVCRSLGLISYGDSASRQLTTL